LNARVTITDGASTRRLTKYETAITQLINKAAAGDFRCLKVVLDIVQLLGMTSERAPITTPTLNTTARDRLMAKLDRMAERMRARAAVERSS
jgi:hypothetical protein